MGNTSTLRDNIKQMKNRITEVQQKQTPTYIDTNYLPYSDVPDFVAFIYSEGKILKSAPDA